MHGAIAMGGGVEFSKGSRSLDLTRLAAVNARGKAFLSARVGHRRMVVARLVNRSVDVSGTSATVNADLELSPKAARAINHVASHHVVSAGAPLGHATATITTG